MDLCKLLCTGVLLGATGLAARGQTTNNAAGGTMTANGATYEWSVGEMALVETFSGTTLTVTQGVLQPVIGTTKVADVPVLAGMLDVYPNPASEHLFLKHRFTEPGTLAYQLLDVTGKTVAQASNPVTPGSGQQSLSLQSLVAGAYLLRVQFTNSRHTESTAVYTISKTR